MTGSPKPLRVLIVAPSPEMIGGQSVQAAALLAGFRAEPSIEVGFQPIDPRLPGPFGVLQRVRYVRTLVTSILYVAGLLARVPRCDVVHVFSASYLSFVLAPTPAILIGRLFGRRVVLNYHSGEAEDHLRRWASAVPTIRLAHSVVVPSRYLVEVFARFGMHARAIENVVDTDRFRFRSRDPIRPVFLSNRNLEPLYNVACVLWAFSGIQKRFPEARLVVAGDGRERVALVELARVLDLENVEFVGRVAPARMPELYDAADVFLNGSDIDNMPVSIIEAFAAGVPVVTTDAGGIPYMVSHEETGLIAPCGDGEALARLAIRLVETPTLATRIARRARDECERYRWAAVRDEWLRLYEEVAGMAGTTASPPHARVVVDDEPDRVPDAARDSHVGRDAVRVRAVAREPLGGRHGRIADAEAEPATAPE